MQLCEEERVHEYIDTCVFMRLGIALVRFRWHFRLCARIATRDSRAYGLWSEKGFALPRIWYVLERKGKLENTFFLPFFLKQQ